jgi:hypothetical protein
VPSASANLTVATTVARWEGGLDEAVLRGPNDVPDLAPASVAQA